jgi:N-acetylglucosaminyldiphosphoundecaprenol N-acetyl-beta-D-mannosaminyltransferase
MKMPIESANATAYPVSANGKPREEPEGKSAEMVVDPLRHVGCIRFLGFRVNPGSIEDYVDLVSESIAHAKRVEVFYHNLHTLHEYLRAESLRRYYRNRVILIDGMPLIPLLRLGGYAVQRRHRVTYVDFIWPLLQQAQERQWRVFVTGQSKATLDAAFARIRQRLPTIRLAGHHGYFSTESGSRESREVIDRINEFGTDLCLVGMGTPRQEQWVHEHRSLIEAPSVLVCGACMEYLAGVANPPPRWMGKWGLEWSYRLFENPARFSYRYLVEPWLLGLLLLRNLMGSKVGAGEGH